MEFMKKLSIFALLALPMLFLSCCNSATGQLQSNPSNEDYEIVGDNCDGMLRIQKDGKYGFINEKREIIVQPIYDKVADFSELFGGICINDRWGSVDKNGNVIIEPKYFVFQQPFKFVDGLVSVRTGTEKTDVNGKWVYINSSGNIAIEIPNAQLTKPFQEKRAFVKVNEKWGLIDINGKFIVEPTFELDGNFQEGLAAVMVNGKYGYINLDGKLVINYKYDTAWDFENGQAKVEINSESFCINVKGEVIK